MMPSLAAVLLVSHGFGHKALSLLLPKRARLIASSVPGRRDSLTARPARLFRLGQRTGRARPGPDIRHISRDTELRRPLPRLLAAGGLPGCGKGLAGCRSRRGSFVV